MATPSRDCSAQPAALAPARTTDLAQARDTVRTADAGLAFASYLRVAAMAGVVLIHSLSGMVTNDAIRGSLTWWTGTILSRGVSWAVPVFIMVSGALLLAPRPSESAGAFYRRRLHRIAIPLVVSHAGYFLVRWSLDHEALTVNRIVADVLHANVYAQLYFFWIVLGMYLVTPLLRSALAGRSRREIAVVGLAGIAFMWAVQAGAVVLRAIGSGTTIWQPAALVLWIPYVGYFVLGYALRDVVVSRRWGLASVVALVVATALGVWQYVYGGGPWLSALLGGGYQGLPIAATAVAVFLIGRALVPAAGRWARSGTRGMLRNLAELTLGVFVIHLLVLRFAWRLPSVSFAAASGSIPMTLGVWLIVLVASFAICFVLARIPILRRTIGM